MALDPKIIASELRLEAEKLQAQSQKLLKAAEVLDPSPSQLNLIDTIKPDIVSPTGVRGRSKKTVADLVEEILREMDAPAPRASLFMHVQARGGSVSKMQNFATMLSREKRFVSLGGGNWDLRERHTNGSEETSQ